MWAHAHIHARTRALGAHACTPPSPTALAGQGPGLSHGFPPAALTPLLSLLPEVGTSYYAVAVVKRSSPVTINTLKGIKSCHTGINRTVGWNVPVGYLVESGRLSVMGCDVLKGEGFELGRGFSAPPGWSSLASVHALPFLDSPALGSSSPQASFKEHTDPLLWGLLDT